MIKNEEWKDCWGCLVPCPARGRAAFGAGEGCRGLVSMRWDNLQGHGSTTNSVTGCVQCSTKAEKGAGHTFVSACGLWFCLFVLLCTDLIGVKFRSIGIKCNPPFLKELPLTSRNFLSFLLPLDRGRCDHAEDIRAFCPLCVCVRPGIGTESESGHLLKSCSVLSEVSDKILSGC